MSIKQTTIQQIHVLSLYMSSILQAFYFCFDLPLICCDNMIMRCHVFYFLKQRKSVKEQLLQYQKYMQQQIYVELNDRNENNKMSSSFRKIKERIVLIFFQIRVFFQISLIGSNNQYAIEKAIQTAKYMFEKHQAECCSKQKYEKIRKQNINGYFLYLAKLSGQELFMMGVNEIMNAKKIEPIKYIEDIYDKSQHYAVIQQQMHLLSNLQSSTIFTSQQFLGKEGYVFNFATNLWNLIEWQRKNFKGKYILSRMKGDKRRRKLKKDGRKKQTDRNARQISNSNSSGLTKYKERFAILYLLKFVYLLKGERQSSWKDIKLMAFVLSIIDFIQFHDKKDQCPFNLLESIQNKYLNKFLTFLLRLLNNYPSSNSQIKDILSNNQQNGEQQDLKSLQQMIEAIQNGIKNEGIQSSFGSDYFIEIYNKIISSLRSVYHFIHAAFFWVRKNKLMLCLNVTWIFLSLTSILSISSIQQPFFLCKQVQQQQQTGFNLSTETNSLSLSYHYLNQTCNPESSMHMAPNTVANNFVIMGLIAFMVMILPTVVCCSYLYIWGNSESNKKRSIHRNETNSLEESGISSEEE